MPRIDSELPLPTTPTRTEKLRPQPAHPYYPENSSDEVTNEASEESSFWAVVSIDVVSNRCAVEIAYGLLTVWTFLTAIKIQGVHNVVSPNSKRTEPLCPTTNV